MGQVQGQRRKNVAKAVCATSREGIPVLSINFESCLSTMWDLILDLLTGLNSGLKLMSLGGCAAGGP